MLEDMADDFDAARAMIRWFESQGMDVRTSARVMGVILALYAHNKLVRLSELQRGTQTLVEAFDACLNQ